MKAIMRMFGVIGPIALVATILGLGCGKTARSSSVDSATADRAGAAGDGDSGKKATDGSGGSDGDSLADAPYHDADIDRGILGLGDPCDPAGTLCASPLRCCPPCSGGTSLTCNGCECAPH